MRCSWQPFWDSPTKGIHRKISKPRIQSIDSGEKRKTGTKRVKTLSYSFAVG